MRQNPSKWVLFIGKRGTLQNASKNASKVRQKCVKNARNTFEENTFWTIPTYARMPFAPAIPPIAGYPENAQIKCDNHALSGPLNRLNAILSLLHPLDRYRTPSPNTGGSPQPPRSKPLGGATAPIVML